MPPTGSRDRVPGGPGQRPVLNGQLSIQRQPIALQRHHGRDSQEQGDGQHFRPDFGDAAAFQQDTPDDAQEVGQGEDFADHLGQTGMPR